MNDNEMLGMNIGTASRKLRKSVMFKVIVEIGLNKCFRCGGLIEKEDDWVLDHKEAWRSSPNPRKSFWDVDNVVFSHLSCNVKIKRVTEHGQYAMYRHSKCRCDKCRAANSLHIRMYRKSRL